MRPRITSTLKSVLVALLWVVLGLGSLASTVVAIWITLSLTRAAAGPETGFLSSAVWLWFVAIVITLGVPFALATWKHQGDARRISLTMAWLPMLWNAGALVLASQMVPDIMGSALRGQGAWVAADRLGDTHSATRVLSALGHQTADIVAPESVDKKERPSFPAEESPPLRVESTAGVDLSRALSVPFTEEGTAILMDVELEGAQERKITLPYLFDTGASFTTISTETANKLGISVPVDAPTLTFNTASGPRESRMVHLPALTLGAVRIEGLLVSVCDGCVNERSVGLLGHNVMREFFAQIDYKNQRMVLIPRVTSGLHNRAYDIEPVVDLKVDGAAEVWLGRVRWHVKVTNRGTVAINNVTPVVKFAGGPALHGRTVAEIKPGATGRSLVEGRATLGGKGNASGHYTLGLAQAFW